MRAETELDRPWALKKPPDVEEFDGMTLPERGSVPKDIMDRLAADTEARRARLNEAAEKYAKYIAQLEDKSF